MRVRFVVNPATTVMLTGALVRAIPLSSVATARKTWAPAGTFGQLNANGALVSSPSFAAPAKNSTLNTAPSRSLASAARFTVDVATKMELVAGLVSTTLG